MSSPQNGHRSMLPTRDAPTVGSNPDRTCPILIHASDIIHRETIPGGQRSHARLPKPIQAPPLSTNPETPLRILNHACDKIIGKAILHRVGGDTSVIIPG